MTSTRRTELVTGSRADIAHLQEPQTIVHLSIEGHGSEACVEWSVR
jgi:hypothetical protein